eukprot:TRINITY_DN3786_c0_g1_i1.p3 TRINITY_DN3786_c0_g1~~TRINITY_DN3786_c0_g1_i1.p3  ORF type:complete len:145 (-),score=15.02 TRINITY_DN3786_c0_g1_i1:427-861(-)
MRHNLTMVTNSTSRSDTAWRKTHFRLLALKYRIKIKEAYTACANAEFKFFSQQDKLKLQSVFIQIPAGQARPNTPTFWSNMFSSHVRDLQELIINEVTNLASNSPQANTARMNMNFARVDWSQLLSEQGGLRLDVVMNTRGVHL